MAAPLARDLDDPAQNRAVLDGASALAEGTTTAAELARTQGAAAAAEAEAAASSRGRLASALAAGDGTPMHLSVV